MPLQFKENNKWINFYPGHYDCDNKFKYDLRSDHEILSSNVPISGRYATTVIGYYVAWSITNRKPSELRIKPPDSINLEKSD
jgi:hypothetical protein